MAERFIQGAVEHPGAATRKAQAEGLSVHQWALKHKKDSGRTGKQARLALTLEKMSRQKKHRRS